MNSSSVSTKLKVVYIMKGVMSSWQRALGSLQSPQVLKVTQSPKESRPSSRVLLKYGNMGPYGHGLI